MSTANYKTFQKQFHCLLQTEYPIYNLSIYTFLLGYVDQAKKMNVESLRSNQNQQTQSAEIRIAKAAITICALFVASWTPYAVLALVGAFGNQ